MVLVGEETLANLGPLPATPPPSTASAAATAPGCSSPERGVPPDVAQAIPELFFHFFDRPGNLQAAGALVVAVLDEGQRSVGPAPDAVPRRVDRAGEEHACLLSGVAAIGDTEDHGRGQEGDHAGGEHTDPSFVLDGRVVDRQLDDEQGDGEPDAAQHAAAGQPVEGQSGPELPDPEPPQDPGGTEDAERLADHQAGEHRPHDG